MAFQKTAAAAALTLVTTAIASAADEAVRAPITQAVQIGEAIAACWHAPSFGCAPMIEVTVRLRLSSKGAVLGGPTITHVAPGSPPELRAQIIASILGAVRQCAPLSFSTQLVDAIAGLFLAIRFRLAPALARRDVQASQGCGHA